MILQLNFYQSKYCKYLPTHSSMWLTRQTTRIPDNPRLSLGAVNVSTNRIIIPKVTNLSRDRNYLSSWSAICNLAQLEDRSSILTLFTLIFLQLLSLSGWFCSVNRVLADRWKGSARDCHVCTSKLTNHH